LLFLGILIRFSVVNFRFLRFGALLTRNGFACGAGIGSSGMSFCATLPAGLVTRTLARRFFARRFTAGFVACDFRLSATEGRGGWRCTPATGFATAGFTVKLFLRGAADDGGFTSTNFKPRLGICS